MKSGEKSSLEEKLNLNDKCTSSVKGRLLLTKVIQNQNIYVYMHVQVDEHYHTPYITYILLIPL